jgi:hypothetical protein
MYKYKYIYSCTHISAYSYALLSQVLYTVCCLSKLYTHTATPLYPQSWH